jgi:hypothetical protein
VLLISGGWRPQIDAAARHGACATCGRHAIVASPNHYPQLENPDEFNPTVEAFMRDSDAEAVNGPAQPAP